MSDIKKNIEDCIHDTVFDFLVYERRGDDILPYGKIQKEIIDGNISIDEIVSIFKKNMETYMNLYKENNQL